MGVAEGNRLEAVDALLSTLMELLGACDEVGALKRLMSSLSFVLASSIPCLTAFYIFTYKATHEEQDWGGTETTTKRT